MQEGEANGIFLFRDSRQAFTMFRGQEYLECVDELTDRGDEGLAARQLPGSREAGQQKLHMLRHLLVQPRNLHITRPDVVIRQAPRHAKAVCALRSTPPCTCGFEHSCIFLPLMPPSGDRTN